LILELANAVAVAIQPFVTLGALMGAGLTDLQIGCTLLDSYVTIKFVGTSAIAFWTRLAVFAFELTQLLLVTELAPSATLCW